MMYDMASCPERACILTWETGFRTTTTRQCDVCSKDIGMYQMPGSPEKGFDLLFLGQGKVRGICIVSCFFKAESNLQKKKKGISGGL